MKLGTPVRTEVNWTDPDEQHRVGSQGQLGSLGLGPCCSPPIHRIWIRGRHRDILQVPVQPSGLGDLLLDPEAAAARNQGVFGRDPMVR